MTSSVSPDQSRSAAPVTANGAPGNPGHPAAVALLPWGAAEWAVIVQPGSDSADILRAVARMPAGLTFAESFGDVDIVLVYRAPPELAGDIDNDDPGPSRRGCANAALRVVLDLHPCRPDSRWMTGGERAAFQAGQVEALESVRRAILHALGVPPVS
ncbi:hypothetical protein [Frankia sp. R82]|uniref:hypothetical protein n=1 Tax=Frankia sp. R82 TaxID=2950553 RepID=UPI0020449E65|nr:hypothetical protein [Frankia sp. R82]MCM3883901.1 hypothetical protein [Frankia sp. R82]